MNIQIELTKKKKVGRPSKEEKRIYSQKHNFNIPDNLTEVEMAKIMQEEADKRGLPIKFVTE